MTWQRILPAGEAATMSPDDAADARAVAATLGVMQGVASTSVTDDGVLVIYDADVVSRPQLASAVRAALNLDEDLRTRGNALMKRVPAYLGLARSLALDERVSPVPEAARQAAASRGTSLRAAGALPVAARFIPGFPLIARLHTLVPVLRSLASWSREASPEAVNEHLERSGLTRELLDRDLATSQEAVAFARDYATDAAGKAVSAASAAATQARDKTREWARKYGERGASGSSEKPEP
ncbi:MAG: hypothetical protein WEC79_02315 [Thermomicrobiales bacterium]